MARIAASLPNARKYDLLDPRQFDKLLLNLRSASLFPLVWPEMRQDFHFNSFLTHGGLPQFYNSKNLDLELSAYLGLYLKEEIAAKALIRNLESFSKFLQVAGHSNGQEINFSTIASDCGIPARTVINHFEVLEDTLLGFFVAPWHSKKEIRKSAGKSKFYFFDLGVVGNLKNRSTLSEGSEEYGAAFENFIALEIRAYLSYKRKREQLQYWRTRSHEVDFLVGESIAVEVKSTELIQPKNLKGLRAFAEERTPHKLIVVSRDDNYRVIFALMP